MLELLFCGSFSFLLFIYSTDKINRCLKKRFVHDLIFKKFYKKKKQEKDETCVICQDDYNKNKKCAKLYCNHNFHKDCIFDWFNEKLTCPLCNDYIVTKYGIKIIELESLLN